MGEEILDRLYDVMTQQQGEEFFIQSFEEFKFLNYYFQISSDWARGSREMVMVSIIIYHQITPEIEASITSLFRKFAEMMQSNEDIYTGFYINDIKNYDETEKERIKKNEQLIKDEIRDLYWETIEETRKKSEEQKLTQLENDRYIFESLEEMSKELKIINEEIESSESSLKTNLIIKYSISNLKNIINDLNEGFIEKMTIIDIEEENGLLAPNDESEIEIQERKNELLKILKEEVSEEEEEEKELNEEKSK
ncbi:hypothetical protein LCGC14_1386960 [marine sediment metagenome]|uniref:Uncharacterized protein n=1 Tax=marine sediment metagenome TaxID=412755 RepID=A0A0F9K169_9ZZZZ